MSRTRSIAWSSTDIIALILSCSCSSFTRVIAVFRCWLVSPPCTIFDGGYVADVILVVCSLVDKDSVLPIVRYKHNDMYIIVRITSVYFIHYNPGVMVWSIAGHSHYSYQGEEKYFYPFHLSTSFRVVVGGLRCSAS